MEAIPVVWGRRKYARRSATLSALNRRNAAPSPRTHRSSNGFYRNHDTLQPFSIFTGFPRITLKLSSKHLQTTTRQVFKKFPAKDNIYPIG